FYLAADADVYVAHDTRISAKPQWLTADYEATGLTIQDDQPVDWEVFKRHYPAGSHVVMGPNGGGSRMNYFILVEPTAPQTPAPDGAPSGLSADSSGEETVLTWDAAAEADSYLVYRQSMLDPGWRAIGATADQQVTGVEPAFGVEYGYRVSALSAGGESDAAAPVESVSYDPSVPAPDVPDVPTAEPNSYSVELSWPEMDETLGYTVHRSTTPDGEYTALGSVAGEEYVDDTVEPDTTYYYALSGVSAGGASERSGPVTVTTGPALEPVRQPEGLTAAEVTAGAVTLTW